MCEKRPLRLVVVQTLGESLNPDVFNRLTVMVGSGADGQPVEADVRAGGGGRSRAFDPEPAQLLFGVQTLLFGLSQGSILVLAAIGLAVTFGVMGVINMAHGELMMLGAYATDAAAAHAGAHRRLHPRRHPGGLPRLRGGRRAHRARHRALPAWLAARRPCLPRSA